jgi:hypothetical protein
MNSSPFLRRSVRRGALGLCAWLVAAAPAAAWPPALEQALYRDAQRLLPRSLAVLLRDRELAVLEAARETRPEFTGFPGELTAGVLLPQTFGAFDAQIGDAADLMQKRQVSAGLVRLGALFRVAADVSDPVLCAEPGAFPPGVVLEYYAFVQKNLPKIPVVLDDRRYLRLGRAELPGYWQSLLVRSRLDAPVIRTELFQSGRLVRHDTLDYRSPVFGVGSLAYSRAVNGIAATWLAGWRTARGDLGGTREPRLLEPKDPHQALTR